LSDSDGSHSPRRFSNSSFEMSSPEGVKLTLA